METLFTIFLVLHIVGGSVGLFTGTIAIIRRKGDKKHKLIGKIFSFSMLTAGFSALVLSLMHSSHFLFMVGVFTIYLVGTGSRYMHLKLLGKTQRPAAIDWVLTGGMLLAGFLFIGLGIASLIAHNNFGIVLIVFGAVGLLFVRTDLANYRGKFKMKNFWLLAHFQRMMGGYIAATTAFLVVNAHYSPLVLPSFVVWLLPTAIITPLIISWSRKYEVKLKNPL